MPPVAYPVAIADYETTAGAIVEHLKAVAGKQPGDPEKAAKAVAQIVEAGGPPLNLVLGPDAYARVRDWQEKFAANMER